MAGVSHILLPVAAICQLYFPIMKLVIPRKALMIQSRLPRKESREMMRWHSIGVGMLQSQEV